MAANITARPTQPRGRSCPGNSQSGNLVDVGRFPELHVEGRRLIEQWFVRAHAGLKRPPEDSFEPFIFGWIGFNGWAACCSDMDDDRDWGRALGSCPELVKSFEATKDAKIDFAGAVQEFSSYWPIFKAQELRRERIDPTGETRSKIVAHYLAHKPRLSRAPECFEDHTNARRAVPADWPHTLKALYQVRCNLFHGNKTPNSEMDRQIVYSALRVLVPFMSLYILT